MQQKVNFITLVMTSLVVGQRISFKALPKAKLAPEKSHGHSLVVCCRSDPQQISESWQKPLYLRGMLGKSMRFSKNCDACS